jgi:two-component system chemotaxis response regulator CheY
LQDITWAGRQLDLSLPALVVDDSSSVTSIVLKIVKNIGFQNVEAALNASAAMEKLRSSSYGLLVTDLEMAGMSGLDLIRCVRADQQLNQLPIVLMTARLQKVTEMVSKKELSGADIHILKPFTVESLRMKLEQRFGHAALNIASAAHSG